MKSFQPQVYSDLCCVAIRCPRKIGEEEENFFFYTSK